MTPPVGDETDWTLEPVDGGQLWLCRAHDTDPGGLYVSPVILRVASCMGHHYEARVALTTDERLAFARALASPIRATIR